MFKKPVHVQWLVVFLGFLLAPFQTCGAAPNELDPSFGSAGHEEIPTGNNAVATNAMLLRADGHIVARLGDAIWQFNADGTPDMAFGDGTGKVDLQSVCTASPLVLRGCQSLDAIAMQWDGKIVVEARMFNNGFSLTYGALRLTADGRADSSFGEGGVTRRTPAEDAAVNDASRGIVIQADGSVLVAGISISQPRCSSLARFLPDGAPDLDFGDHGRLCLTIPGEPIMFASEPDGRLFILTGPAADVGSRLLGVVRLLPDGQLDQTFAIGGAYVDPTLPSFTPVSMAIQPDGKLVIAGNVSTAGVDQAAVLRLDSTGNFDFLTTIPIGSARLSGRSQSAIAVDSQGRILVVGDNTSCNAVRQIVVARLNPDGSPDDSFAPRGVTTFWYGPLGAGGDSIVVQANEAILVGGTIEETPIYGTFGSVSRRGRPTLYRLQGGDGSGELTSSEGNAVEYYHAGFDNYFISADTCEIATLDGGYPAGWARTGLSFKVWTEGGADLNPVCRFFSDQSFAPRSTHFYTPYPEECAALRTGTLWKYEGDAFYAGLPVGPPGAGTCRPGNAPLYRLYNNNQGGAPNHRYTNDLAVVDQMLASGWIFEGEADTKVFACIPLPQ